MPQGEAAIRVSHALRVIGLIGAAVGGGTVLLSTLVYVQDHEFSLFATYLSDIGNTPKWPQAIFNSGQLIVAPLRYLFLVFLVIQLRNLGAGKAFAWWALTVGGLVVIGSIGLAAIPYSLSLPLHKMSALLYFFGVVLLQSVIAAQEWRRRVPSLLPISSMGVVAVYLVFAVLLSLVGKVEGITRSTPVIWEWLAFCSLLFWIISHSIVLGGTGPRRERS